MQAHDHATSGATFLPHGFCYLWDPQLLWTHVIADLFIGLAYVTISVSLAWLVHRVRRDIPFSWAFVAFGLFIITCGMTHFMEIWTLWQPVYWLSGGVKVVTAVASIVTAAAMPFTVPRAVATVRDARMARERELSEARAVALQEQNDLLRVQALELERANESKSAFLRTMSHELRTPLNAIIGYGQLLESGVSGTVTDVQVDQLRRIKHSAAHLLGVIDEVLTLARAGGEAQPPRIAEVRLQDLVPDVLIMIEPQAHAAGLELVTGPTPDVTLSTDAGRVRQILLNLLANAVKFTGSGRISLHTELAGERLQFHVTDTGSGIAAEHLERVFEPFWQVDQRTTRLHGGSGLGLAVSRQLARTLGGDVVVRSEPGSGSTFTLELPLHYAADTTSAGAAGDGTG